MTGSALALMHRGLIVTLAARYNLPALFHPRSSMRAA